DRLADAGDFVAAEIVRNDDVSGRERWCEDLFDVGEEGLPVHGSVEDKRGSEPAGAQAGYEGRCLPMPVRNRCNQALAPRSAPAQARHGGGCPSLIDEDQPVRIQASLARAPNLACSRDIRPLLLGGMKPAGRVCLLATTKNGFL